MYLIQARLQICVVNINLNFFKAHSDSGTEYQQMRSVYFVEFDPADRNFHKYKNVIIIIVLMEFHCIRECANRKSAVWGLNIWASYLCMSCYSVDYVQGCA